MGTIIKCLHLIAAAIFAFSTAPDIARRTMAITRASGATTRTSEAWPGVPEDGTVSGTVRVTGPQTVATRIDMAADPARHGTERRAEKCNRLHFRGDWESFLRSAHHTRRV